MFSCPPVRVFSVPEILQPHRGHGAVVQSLICKQHGVLNEHGAGSQDERREEVDVDVVSGAVELPVFGKKNKEHRTLPSK